MEISLREALDCEYANSIVTTLEGKQWWVRIMKRLKVIEL